MARRLAAVATSLTILGTLLVPATAAPGVTSAIIKIGLHAPLTGAAPVPTSSVENGKDLYFRWLKETGRAINGRDVRVVLKNDGYNPSQAVAVCKEMVEQDHVFMIFGMSGGDQMTACARYAASVGVPYVAPGGYVKALASLENYFATSMTWRAQGRLLADYFVAERRARARKNGVLYFDSPSWSEPVGPFRRTLEDRDATLHYERGVAPGAGMAEARLVVEEMKIDGIQNVFVNTSPVWFLQVISEANAQDFAPNWIGIDSGMAKNTVTAAGCSGGGSLDGARSFSPYPGIADTDRFDPAFRRAVNRLHPDEQPDDFMWQLWALDKAIAKMLGLTGDRPTRTRFIARVERATIRTGILPPLRYRPSDHFGSKATHVLRAECSDKRWHTGPTYKSDFLTAS